MNPDIIGALGAQAATLMTMRSAYDTATEYCAELEGEINRKAKRRNRIFCGNFGRNCNVY